MTSAKVTPASLRKVLLSSDVVVQLIIATSDDIPVVHAFNVAQAYLSSLDILEAVERTESFTPPIVTASMRESVNACDKAFDAAIIALYHYLSNDDSCGECPACKFRDQVQKQIQKQNASMQ